MKGLDRFLTTEPDNGYDKWIEEVWQLVSTQENCPTEEEVNDYWSKFFEPLTRKLSVSGTLPSGGCAPSFAALVICRRWRQLKREFPYLLEYLIY